MSVAFKQTVMFLGSCVLICLQSVYASMSFLPVVISTARLE